jgi:hypothetical protein
MTRGLKVNPVHTLSGPCLIESEGKRILMCSRLSETLMHETLPDIVVLKGKYPVIDRGINPDRMPEVVIIGSESSAKVRLTKSQRESPAILHDTGKAGAFRRRL